VSIGYDVSSTSSDLQMTSVSLYVSNSVQNLFINASTVNLFAAYVPNVSGTADTLLNADAVAPDESI